MGKAETAVIQFQEDATVSQAIMDLPVTKNAERVNGDRTVRSTVTVGMVALVILLRACVAAQTTGRARNVSSRAVTVILDWVVRQFVDV